MPALLSSAWQRRNLTTTLLSNKWYMNYDNKYKSQYLNSNQRFMSNSVLKLKKQQLPQIKCLLIPPIICMLTAVNCVHSRIWERVIMIAIIIWRQVNGHAVTTITTGVEKQSVWVPSYLGILALPGPHHSNKAKHRGCLCGCIGKNS